MKKIKVFFTDVCLSNILNEETESTGNNCGPLSILMIIMTDFKDMINNFKIERIIKMTKKEGKESTMPGFMCQCLIKLGYTVQYFSQIDWHKCTTSPEISLSEWDPMMRQLAKIPWFNVTKMQQSAIWLTDPDQKDIVVRQNLTIDNLAQFLKDKKRVITIVDQGKHYVVVTGIDAINVYFNDPNTGTNRSMCHRHFKCYWGNTQVFSETIVAYL